MLGIYKCHCCNCPTLSYHVISTFHRLIDLSIPHSKPTHQKQSEPYIGYTCSWLNPFLLKITLNIFFVGGVRTEIHLPTPRSFLDQRKGEPNDGDDGSGHAAAAFAPLPGRTARRPSVGRRISQRRSTETQDGQTPRWMRCEGQRFFFPLEANVSPQKNKQTILNHWIFEEFVMEIFKPCFFLWFMKLPCFFGELIALVPKTSLFQEDPELQISATAFHQQRTSLDLKHWIGD